MSTSTATRPRAKPAPTPQPSPRQRRWITARDRFGYAIDNLLATEPSDELRLALRRLEIALAVVDHALGL